jgi:hypothetical protein
VAALAVIVFAILAAGIISQVLLKPGQTVAVVNGTKIPTGDYDALVSYQRANLQGAISNLETEIQSLDATDETNQFLISYYQQMVQQYEAQLSSVQQTALEDLIDDALIAEKADQSGIKVTPDEVSQTIRDDLTQIAISGAAQVTTTETVTGTLPTPTPTAVPQETLDQIYEQGIANLGLSDKQFRAIVQRGLVRSKVQDLLVSEVPTTGLIIHVQMIVTDTNEVASAAEARIKSGEDFAAVAGSVDPGARENGGDVGWLAAGQIGRTYGQALEDWVLAQEPGTLGVVESDGKFYVVKVLEKNENGTLPDAQITYLQGNALTDWLAARKASPDVQIDRLTTPGGTPTQAP